MEDSTISTIVKAVVFDIDNTLTNDVSWLRTTELLGASVVDHQEIFRRFTTNQLSYEEAKFQLISLWKVTGRADKSTWENMFNNWPLKGDAADLMSYIRHQGYVTALITGSYDLFAAAIAKKLGVPYWYANTTLVWDDNNNLIDFHYVRDQAAEKLVHLRQFVAVTGMTLENCVVIGDGDNDLEIFKATGRGVAVGSSNVELLNVAWKQVDELSEIAGLI